MRAPDSALVPSDLVLSPNALEALRMSELRKHAVIIGVARADIAKAVDSDRPKQMLIEMVLEQTAALGQALLRVVAELRDLRQSALEERAQAEGVSERELEEAIDDDEDPTGAIIKLILAQPTEQIADRNTVGPPSDAGVPVCPFCVNRSLSSRAIEAVPGGSRTRQRRELKSERKTPKWGRWWRQFGYNGPKCASEREPSMSCVLYSRMDPLCTQTASAAARSCVTTSCARSPTRPAAPVTSRATTASKFSCTFPSRERRCGTSSTSALSITA